jgi:hypothetical protein
LTKIVIGRTEGVAAVDFRGTLVMQKLIRRKPSQSRGIEDYDQLVGFRASSANRCSSPDTIQFKPLSAVIFKYFNYELDFELVFRL